jgi:hypothetical protein
VSTHTRGGLLLEREGTCSTFSAVLAEVSRKRRLCSLAKAAPSSLLTCLLLSRSHLLPISMITMLLLLYFLQSSSHDVRCSKVSRLCERRKD